MRTIAIAIVVASTLASVDAKAAPVADHVRAQLLGALPAGTDVARVHLPASLEKLDVGPEAVSIELPSALRIGRRSIKVTVRGHRSMFVPVTIGAIADVAITEHALAAGATIADADVRFETRAVEGAPAAAASVVVGARTTQPIAAGVAVESASISLPPPLARGAQVTVELRRGRVRARSTGTLELAVRRGGSAVVRLTQSKSIVHGTLVGPTTVVVEGPP